MRSLRFFNFEDFKNPKRFRHKDCKVSEPNCKYVAEYFKMLDTTMTTKIYHCLCIYLELLISKTNNKLLSCLFFLTFEEETLYLHSAGHFSDAMVNYLRDSLINIQIVSSKQEMNHIFYMLKMQTLIQ